MSYPSCYDCKLKFLACMALAAVVGCLAGRGGAGELQTLVPRGADLVNPEGEVVTLRGCNLGNWFLIESWMLGIDTADTPDHHTFVQTLVKRFGQAEAVRLMDVHYANWITPADLKRLRGFGFNAVRLPFYYESVDTEPGVRDFRWLDHAIKMCQEAGLYVILDLHGAPGGQSIDQPCGRVDSNELWASPGYQQQTIDLWTALAERYADNPAVAAYDLLNEPYGDLKQDVRPMLLGLMERLVPAVRSVDPDTLLYVPGALHGMDFYGPPRDRGWVGVGITEHAYPGLFGSETSVASHLAYLGPAIERKRKLLAEWDCPYLLGEFNPVFERVGGAQMMRRYFERAEQVGWAATMWSCKIVSPDGGMPGDNWPLIANADPIEPLDILNDSAQTIEAKLKYHGTMRAVQDDALRQEMNSSDPLPQWEYPEAATLPDQSAALPSPWKGFDIGGAVPGGQAVDEKNRWTFYGGGRDIFGVTDQFRYVARPVDGDFGVWMVIDSVETFERYAKFGWMLRASDRPDAAHRLLHIFPSGQMVWAGRDRAGGESAEQSIGTGRFPIGLGLERRGGQLIARATDLHGKWRVVQEEALPAALTGRGMIGTVVLAHSTEGYASMVPSHWQWGGRAPEVSRHAGKNLLVNGSFESPNDARQHDDTAAAGWFTWGQGLNRQTGWSPLLDGDCLFGYHHWELSESGNAGMWQDVKGLTPGKNYEFSLAVARDLAGAGSREADTIEMRLESPSLTPGGQPLTLATRTYKVADLESGDVWNPMAVSAIAPGKTLRVLVSVSPAADGSRGAALKFDDAKLSRN